MENYALLLEKMSKDELEKKISEKIQSMHGFLTREAAIRILLRELGLKKKLFLSEIKEGVNDGFVLAKIERILPLQQFESGKCMRKIVVSDNSGLRELKLWNEDVQLLNSIYAGDVIEVHNIYCKNNELNLGYSGKIIVVQHGQFAELGALANLEGKNVNVHGYVESIEGMRDYEKNGSKRKMFFFIISDGKNSVRAIIWDKAERGNSLAPGMEIKVENALVRNGELHLNAFSRMMIKKKQDGVRGKVERIEVVGEQLVLDIDGKRYSFERKDALIVLDVRVAEDIALETIVELKKGTFLGKEVFIEMKDGKIGKAIVKD